MVVNCNTVLFEFGALNATYKTRVNLTGFKKLCKMQCKDLVMNKP